MALTLGTRLGPYEILSVIGAGGMGQVYKARDTRLERTVAIKVLHGVAQADPDSRTRFEREARLLASFDHPHICALHDVGREGDVDYLVMPYLTGETLAGRLAKGVQPLSQVIEIATQIADALDRAHGHGIIHRDLKPANVMLTPSGVRLLDFGLGRLDEPPSAAKPEDVPTRSVLTRVGAVMGTVPYMSPEQLTGKPVDSHTDIWAFGCVLYQMIAGRAPFQGDSDAALISAILASEPESLSERRPGVPPILEEIVAGALAKDPEARWQNMRDVRRTLAIAGRTPSAAPLLSASSSRARRLVVPVLAVAAIGFAVLASAVWKRPAESSPVRFDLNASGVGTIRTFSDVRPYFAASPDGRRIVFQATVEGRSDLWVKELERDRPERLADTQGAASPFWSPDGQSVAFYSDGKLKRKSLGGGPAQPLCDADSQGINGAWNANGVVLFSEWGTRRIMQVPESGGTAVVVRQGEKQLTWVHFLPDGRHFLYGVQDTGGPLFVGSLDSDSATQVTGVSGRAEFAEGQLVFWREGGLIAQSFDLKTFQLTGQAVAVADNVHAFDPTGFAAFSVAPNLLVYQAGAAANRLVWFDRQGLEVGTVGPVKQYVDLRLSPDGLQVASSVRDSRLGSNDVFVHELDRDLTRPLTSDRGTENAPMWSPDGKSIVYAADRHGAPSLHIRSSDGSGEERQVVPPAVGPGHGGSFTPDGRSLVFAQPNPGTNYDIMLAPLDGHSPPVAIVKTRGRELTARVSPDGRWLAYQSSVSGRSEVYVQSLLDGHGRRQVSRDGGDHARWRGDGKELYFIAGAASDQVMAASVAMTAETIATSTPRLLFVARDDVTAYDVTNDGQKFLLVSPDRVAERGTLSVVMNWVKLFQK